MNYQIIDRQIIMNQFLPGQVDLTADGIRGTQTIQAELAVAVYFGLNAMPQSDCFFDFLASSFPAISKNLDLTRITALNGERVPCRCSTFGGKDDTGDRMYGQSFIDTFQAETPRAIAEAWIVRDYIPRTLFLLQDMMQNTAWPVVNGETMGLSYFLNPNESYAALRIPTGLVKKAMRNGRMKINLFAPKTNQMVSDIIITDFGPNVSTKRAVDISPGVMETLHIKTDDIVCIAWSR